MFHAPISRLSVSSLLHDLAASFLQTLTFAAALSTVLSLPREVSYDDR